ncbi:MAG: hypothetical protein ACMG6E_06990, partial [Candidatus Roizmanbacteria bacterium]
LPTINTRASQVKYALDMFGPKTVMKLIIDLFINQKVKRKDQLLELCRKWCSGKKPFLSFELGFWTEEHTTETKGHLIEFIDIMSKACKGCKSLMRELTVVSVKLNLESLADICSRTAEDFTEEEGDLLFKITSGKMRFIVFRRLGKASKDKLASSIGVDRDTETFNSVCALAAYCTPKEMAWIHESLNINSYSVSEFIFALGAGNLPLVEDMISQKRPGFISKSNILTSILFAFGTNPQNEDWDPVAKYIFEITQKDVTIRAHDAVELMCTEYFRTKRSLIAVKTNWDDFRFDNSRAYGLICDGELCKLLEKNEVFKGWLNATYKPRFTLYPWMPVDQDAIRILSSYGLI